MTKERLATVKEAIQSYSDGIISSQELAKHITKVNEQEANQLAAKKANYREQWFSHVNECLYINWQFGFDSPESKELTKHINGIKALIIKASDSVA